MIDKVRNTVKKHGMLRYGDNVTVGLSGGADSMSLLVCMMKLREEYGLTVKAVHVNHGIRGEEAKRDENFVRKFCSENGIDLKVFSYDIPSISASTGESEEECGRRIRYECFNSVANGGVIATAHTLSDSIETMVFNLIRGCGINGLCGVPEKRDNIIRPLIECSRCEIEEFCSVNNIEYVTDSTNFESIYSRNFIRNELLPMFSSVNSSYASSLHRLIVSAKTDNAYLEKQSRAFLESVTDSEGFVICSKAVKGDSALISRALIHFVIDRTGIVPEYRHILLISELLKKDGAVQLDADNYILSRNGKLFSQKRFETKATAAWEKDLYEGVNITEKCIIDVSYFKKRDIIFNQKSSDKLLDCFIDCDKIRGKLVIRSRKDGDKITLAARNVTKTLKKLFTEMKIPVNERNSIPVIADEEKVLWVYSVGYNKECEIDKNTQNIIRIKAEER